MALDFRSNSFKSTRNELEKINSSKGGITSTELNKILEKNNVDLGEFKKANKAYKDFLNQPNIKKLVERGIDPTEPTIVDQIFLAPTRSIGQSLSGLLNLGDAAARSTLEKETYDNSIGKLKANTPDALASTIDAISDPYHGEGIIGTASHLTGDIGSYIAAGGGAAKLGKLAFMKSPSLGRQFNKLGQKSKKVVKGGALGLAGAMGATVVENPTENGIDYLYAALLSSDPEALEKLEAAVKNPEDLELQDYLDAAIKNIAFSAGVGLGFFGGSPVVNAIINKHRGAINSRVGSVTTRLDGILEPITKSKFGRKFTQNFTSRRGTDDVTLARVIERESAASAALKEAGGYADDLKKSIKDNLQDKINQDPNYVENVVDQALKGESSALQRLAIDSPDTAKIVDDMRLALNNVQRELRNTTGVSSGLQATIDNSLGTYMTRSYEIFDNPKYREQIQKLVQERMSSTDPNKLISDKVVDAAAQFIAKQKGISPNDPIVQETLEKLVGVGAKDAEAFRGFIADIANKQVLSNTGKPLFKRKNIPVEIRNLFGEIKDPSLNFTKTYEKLATLNAENKFLSEMAETLERRFVERVNKIKAENPALTDVQATLRAKEQMIDVSSIGSDALGAIVGKRPLSKGQIKNPLQGVYADKEYADIMSEGLNPEFTNSFLKIISTAKGISQKAKTVYNPATHAKNIVGNIAMLGANGMIPVGETIEGTIKGMATQLGKKSTKELGKKMAMYDRLGITNSNLGLGEIRSNLRTISNDVDGWLNKTSSGTRVIKKGDEFITNLYQAEDDFFKIIHFEKTLDYLKKAYPELVTNGQAADELIQMAAQRTRDLMPNYNLVPTAIKALRGAPIGDFVSFPAEMIRITKNLGTYTFKDLGSGKDELFKAGAKRLGGMTIVGAAPTIAMETTKGIYDISDEEAKAIEMLGPAYEVNTDKIYLSPINQDKNGHWGVDYVNVGSWDPFSYIKSFSNNIHDLIMSGIVEPEATSYELNKTAAALIDQTISPFIGPSMITEAVSDLIRGKDYSDEPTLKGKLQDSAKIAVDLFDPGFIRWWNRRQQNEATGMTDYYSTIPDSSTDILALAGLKTQRADLTNGMRFNLNPEFNKIFNAQNQMNDSLGNPNVVPEMEF